MLSKSQVPLFSGILLTTLIDFRAKRCGLHPGDWKSFFILAVRSDAFKETIVALLKGSVGLAVQLVENGLAVKTFILDAEFRERIVDAILRAIMTGGLAALSLSLLSTCSQQY
jgi:hypothetical protein